MEQSSWSDSVKSGIRKTGQMAIDVLDKSGILWVYVQSPRELFSVLSKHLHSFTVLLLPNKVTEKKTYLFVKKCIIQDLPCHHGLYIDTQQVFVEWMNSACNTKQMKTKHEAVWIMQYGSMWVKCYWPQFLYVCFLDKEQKWQNLSILDTSFLTFSFSHSASPLIRPWGIQLETLELQTTLPPTERNFLSLTLVDWQTDQSARLSVTVSLNQDRVFNNFVYDCGTKLWKYTQIAARRGMRQTLTEAIGGESDVNLPPLHFPVQ